MNCKLILDVGQLPQIKKSSSTNCPAIKRGEGGKGRAFKEKLTFSKIKKSSDGDCIEGERGLAICGGPFFSL